MAVNAFAAYPDHNKWFNIYNDASDFQLGACIIQGRPVTYFSCKLTKSQHNYTTIKKEMFSMSQLLKNSHVFMDHKNLTFDTLKTQNVLR